MAVTSDANTLFGPPENIALVLALRERIARARQEDVRRVPRGHVRVTYAQLELLLTLAEAARLWRATNFSVQARDALVAAIKALEEVERVT